MPQHIMLPDGQSVAVKQSLPIQLVTQTISITLGASTAIAIQGGETLVENETLVVDNNGTVAVCTSVDLVGGTYQVKTLTTVPVAMENPVIHATQTLSKVIGGISTVTKTGSETLINDSTLVTDPAGTLAIYNGTTDATTYQVETISIVTTNTATPVLIGNVQTNADLPVSVAAVVSAMGRTPIIGDYARVQQDETANGNTLEWYITDITGDVITWGNSLILNTSDYQEQTTTTDAGNVPVAGTTAGTWGISRPIQTTPTANSTALITSGAVAAVQAAKLDKTDPSTTNARTPLVHATTHAPGGTDPVSFDLASVATGVLPVAKGGTGLTAQPQMLTNLGSSVADNVLYATPRPGVTGTLPLANGGTGATTAAAARNNLGLGNTTGPLPVANGGTGAADAASARNALGLGNTVAALPVANGGTGSTTAAAALAALGGWYATVTTVDPGEGSPIAANQIILVVEA